MTAHPTYRFNQYNRPTCTQAIAHFWLHVDITDEKKCWHWKGPRGPQGYGMFGYLGKVYRTHRFAYESTYGLLLPGFQVLHHCDNPPCCNTNHLFVGTNALNVIDRDQKARTPKGQTHASTKYPDIFVQLARSLANTMSQKDIAKQLGTSKTWVWSVLHYVDRKSS